jgi:hypothetical protein
MLSPDLVYRLKHNKPLIQYIRPRFYGPFPDPQVGYSDFPFSEELCTTPGRIRLLEESKKLGLKIAEPGWQLSRSGIQLGGLFGRKVD